ncbi:putative DNA primase/helicase [Mesorhizobium jarvisii]
MTDDHKTPLTRGDVDREIERLSHLDVVDYELVREAKAEQLEIRVVVLDALIKRKRDGRGAADSIEADSDHQNEGDTRPPAFTDEALALRFAAKHCGVFRYVAKWNRWLVFDGRRWAPDETVNVFDRVRETCRQAAAACNEMRVGKTLASAKTVAAVEKLAKADRRLAATTDQWDADPWLLNTPGGVVDLKAGLVLPHSPGYYMTKMTSVAPDPGMPSPLFDAFIDRVTGGDHGLQTFLQRFLGYGLTGITSEHAMAFFYGTGSNGKSVLLTTVSDILASYHVTAPFETFAEARNERHPTDVAGLKGARLVTASEVGEGKNWDEAKLKRLTGGDLIAARFMRGDFFEFVPQFKLIVAGNHKPSLRTVDEGIRRRLNLVPFSVTIPKDERDVRLPEKLKAEWPAILAWMVAGCLEWHDTGLAPPPAVVTASAEYLAEEDTFARWLSERCELGLDKWALGLELYQDFCEYAKAGNETISARNDFSSKLKETPGITANQRNAGRGFGGLSLKPKNTDAHPSKELEALNVKLERMLARRHPAAVTEKMQ